MMFDFENGEEPGFGFFVTFGELGESCQKIKFHRSFTILLTLFIVDEGWFLNISDSWLADSPRPLNVVMNAICVLWRPWFSLMQGLTEDFYGWTFK